MTPSIAISVMALVFSIASFWWLQARRGRLTISRIPAFSGYFDSDKRLNLRLPILLYNTGARTRLVDELRLVFPCWEEEVAYWQTSHPTLRPQSAAEDTTDFASPYPISGLHAEIKFIKFSYAVGRALPEPKSTHCRIEARLDGSSTWTVVGHSVLNLTHMHSPESYITYSNSPAPCKGEPESTYTAWKSLADSNGLQIAWADEPEISGPVPDDGNGT